MATNWCPRCRQTKRNPYNRTGMCNPCSGEAAMQYLRIKAMDTEREEAEAEKRIPGEPKNGYGSTYRYMKVRRTPNLIHGVNREFKAVSGGALSYSELVKPLKVMGFLRKKN